MLNLSMTNFANTCSLVKLKGLKITCLPLKGYLCVKFINFFMKVQPYKLKNH